MLQTDSTSPELLAVIRELMKLESLQKFRLVGGTALALQLGHRESVDIDLFSSNHFPGEKICNEINAINKDKKEAFVKGGIMITTFVNGVKVDIIDDKKKFIRPVVVEDGIRMAHLEEITAMKIKTTCDPFSGRKTQKDLADIATLLDTYSVKDGSGCPKECPNCGSPDTSLKSEFGSTACKALYICQSCKEPFDYFKCH